MEDTIILKQHYLYMFRWDAEATAESQQFMLDTLEEMNITNFVGKHEIGKETKKPHYQMAVWCENKKSEKDKDLIRKRFKRSDLTHKTKGAPCAFKSGRKIQSLTSYCLKDEGEIITNLSKQLLDKIPKWKNKSAEKLAFNDKVNNYVGSLEPGHLEIKVELIIKFYISHDVMPPSRGRMLFLLLKHNHIDAQTYRFETYNFKMFYEYEKNYSGQTVYDHETQNMKIPDSPWETQNMKL